MSKEPERTKQPVLVYQLKKAGFTDLDIHMTVPALSLYDLNVDLTRYVGKRVSKTKKQAEIDWLKQNIHFQYGPFGKYKHDKTWEVLSHAMQWESLFAGMHALFGLTAVKMPIAAKTGDVYAFFIGIRLEPPKGMTLSQLLEHDREFFTNEQLQEIEAEGYELRSY